MDQNIAALLREDAKTVHVRFFHDSFKTANTEAFTMLGDSYALLSNKTYTYLTTLDLVAGDTCVVFAPDIIQLAYVDSVDDGVDLMPKDSLKYRWVVAKVDMSYYEDLMEANKRIEATVQSAYKKHTRSNFQQLMLAELGLGDSEELRALCKGFVPNATKGE